MQEIRQLLQHIFRVNFITSNLTLLPIMALNFADSVAKHWHYQCIHEDKYDFITTAALS